MQRSSRSPRDLINDKPATPTVRPSGAFLAAVVLTAALIVTSLPAVSGPPAAAPPQARPSDVGPGDATLYKHYKGPEAFGCIDAWKMGITGRGVNVAVSDSGIDFGHPDLYGSQARVTTKNSPYYGWPIVIDLFSTTMWQDGGAKGNQLVDTSSTDTTGFTTTGTSKSGVYHIGQHPDRRLQALYGQPVRLLLVDEKVGGDYDTVYMDLDGDHDFRNDKPCRKGDEIAVWDRDKDGLFDESGGIIYFIADGKTPLPLGRLLYGAAARVPKKAELVAIQYDWGGHGTMCAGTIGARGRLVKGIAPGVSLIPVQAFPDDVGMLITSLGYDGLPGTGDEADVISRSAGFPYANKGGDELSALLEYLTTKVVPRTTFVFAAANEGAGYGTLTSPSAPHVITGGAIEDLWFKGSPNRGDVAAFSGRGPNILGMVKPNVLGTGAYSPRVRPLSTTHVGATAFDRHGGGTSNGTPHVAGLVALIYQAYKERHGVFPTSEIARDILMSSADDLDEEPFAQGAGSINGRRAAEFALGRAGVLASPAVVSPNEPLAAGSTFDARIALENHSGQPLTAVPQRLVRTGRTMIKVPAAKVRELVAVPKDALGGDILRLSSFVPPGPRDLNLDDTARFGFWLSAYDWRDANHDGAYGPQGAVTPENAQSGEVELLANTDWGCGGTSEVRVHNPAQRIHDGLLLGLAHTEMDPGREVNSDPALREDSDVVIVVESFTWQPWNAMSVQPARGGLDVRLRVPEDSGIYQGRILLASAGGAVKHSVPVSFSVYRKDGIRLAATDEIYENDKLYARLEGSGRDGYRDNRFFAFHHEGTGLVSLNVAWQDPLTDVDLYLYGPGTVDTSKGWTFSGNPPVKLPVLPVWTEAGRTPRRIQTAKPLTPATDKTLIANAGPGVHILVVYSANNSRKQYGETIRVTAAPVPDVIPQTTNLTGAAGSTLEFMTAADALIGFGAMTPVPRGPDPYRFEARGGDHLLLKFGGIGEAMLYFDTNGDGKAGEDKDIVVLHDVRYDALAADRGVVVPLPYDGTYFLAEFEGTMAILAHRWPARGGIVSAPVPVKAGSYVGVLEKAGTIIRGDISLDVKGAGAVRVEVKPRGPAACGRPAEVNLRLLDAFDNPAQGDMDAVVSVEGVEKTARIQSGAGRLEIAAPAKPGEFPIVARTPLGRDRGTLTVAKATSVVIEAASVSAQGVAARVVNMSGADLAVTIYANPAVFPPSGEPVFYDYPPPFFWRGYKAGYLPLAVRTKISLKAGEEKQVTLPFDAKEKPGVDVSTLPYIVAAVDDGMKALGHGVAGALPVKEPPTPGRPPVPPGKPLESLKDTPLGESLSFAASGLVSVRLNEEPPLFFVASGELTVIPDAAGTLAVKTEKAEFKIHVAEPSPPAGKPAAPPSGDKAPAQAPARPDRVTGVRSASEKDGARFTWTPPAGDIDHYVVYRMGGQEPRKEGETSEPTYLLKAEAWNSYTVRIVAVDKKGVESEPSDPCGIVFVPVR